MKGLGYREYLGEIKTTLGHFDHFGDVLNIKNHPDLFY